MKIFLTGGTGFIGSHFINAAHDAGHEIIAIKRESSQTRIPLMKEPNWITGDLDCDFSKYLSNCEVLVHFNIKFMHKIMNSKVFLKCIF